MLFTEKIKELDIQNQKSQRQIAVALCRDAVTYCKIEKVNAELRKDRSQYYRDLFTLWFADKVIDMVSDN